MKTTFCLARLLHLCGPSLTQAVMLGACQAAPASLVADAQDDARTQDVAAQDYVCPVFVGCISVPEQCPMGYVASATGGLGSCWGPCVPLDRCRCNALLECPQGHCGPDAHCQP